MSKLRDSSGTVVSGEEVVAGVARSHFESLGKGEWEDSDEISVGEDGNEHVARGWMGRL